MGRRAWRTGAALSPRPSEQQAPGRVRPEAHLHRRLSRLGSVLSADTVLGGLPPGEGRPGVVWKVRQTAVGWGLRREPGLGQGERLWERKECASWGTEVTGFQLLDTGDQPSESDCFAEPPLGRLGGGHQGSPAQASGIVAGALTLLLLFLSCAACHQRGRGTPDRYWGWAWGCMSVF